MEKDALLAFVESLDKWAIFFALLVAVGVAGEFVVGYLHWTKGKALRSIESEESRAQQLEIAAARKDAAEANLARVQIEERLASRRLSTPQQSELRERLAPFAAGARHVSFICPPDPEPATIGKSILDTLLAAGWAVTNIWGHDNSRAVGGIYVELASAADADTSRAANELVAALRAVPGLTVVGPQGMVPVVHAGAFGGASVPPVKTMAELSARLDAATIRITIGPK